MENGPTEKFHTVELLTLKNNSLQQILALNLNIIATPPCQSIIISFATFLFGIARLCNIYVWRCEGSQCFCLVLQCFAMFIFGVEKLRMVFVRRCIALQHFF